MAEFCTMFPAVSPRDYWELPEDETNAMIDVHNRRIAEQKKAPK